MAHGDGAAVDVDPVVRDVEGLHVAQHDRGESLVQLEQVDVLELHLGALQQLFGHVDRAGQHDRRLGADVGEGADAGARLHAQRLAGLLRAEQHGGGAIDDAGRIAGMVHVVDLLDFRMALDGDGVEAAHLAGHGEGRVERASACMSVVGPHMLVMVEDGQAVLVLHRHDRVLEVALLPGLGRALLALHRIGVDVVAREAVFGGDQVGRNALRHEIARQADRRVHEPGAAGHAHADARHRSRRRRR